MTLTPELIQESVLALAEGRATAFKAAKGLTSTHIDQAITNLLEIQEYLEKKESAAKELEEQKAKVAQEIIEKINSTGLSLDEIAGLTNLSAKTDSRKTVKIKYAVEIDGVQHNWSGRGRTPVAIAKYLTENGLQKEDILINDN